MSRPDGPLITIDARPTTLRLAPRHMEATWTVEPNTNLGDRTTLVLGCGKRPVEGALNHDRSFHAEYVDMAFDLDLTPWPLPAQHFRRIIALDVFEHLSLEPVEWLRECWSYLQDGGELVLRVSAWDNPVSYRDPTHRRVFHEETFDYFCPGLPLYEEYGVVYFGATCPTFEKVKVTRQNPDPRYGVGDIFAVLRKVARR